MEDNKPQIHDPMEEVKPYHYGRFNDYLHKFSLTQWLEGKDYITIVGI